MKRIFTALILLALVNTLAAQAGKIMVIYVKSGDSVRDADSYTALTKVVSRLNSANQSRGHVYELSSAETFEAAGKLIEQDAGHHIATAGVAHGYYTLGTNVYSGNVQEVGDTQPEQDAAGYFNAFAHCGANGEINGDAVGGIIASVNPDDTYPVSGGSGSGGGGGGGGGGHYVYYSSQEWVYFVGSNGHLGSYLGTVTIGVWVPNDAGGGVQYLASNTVDRRELIALSKVFLRSFPSDAGLLRTG